MIEIRSFSFAYRKNSTVLTDCSVTIGAGEIVNILGPNGSGKSTLLKAMLGLLPVGKNTIFVHGRDITRMRQSELAKILNYVPQTHQGVFNYRVLDMVLMARTSRAPWFGFTDADHAIACDALRRVRLSALADRPYLELSGGQRQLVMIARALAQGGQYFIMDEPVAGLDYGNQYHLLETIQSLASSSSGQHAASFILTTHHPEHARFLGGRAILMKDGRILSDGPAIETVTPPAIRSLYGLSASLLHKLSFFNG